MSTLLKHVFWVLHVFLFPLCVHSWSPCIMHQWAFQFFSHTATITKLQIHPPYLHLQYICRPGYPISPLPLIIVFKVSIPCPNNVNISSILASTSRICKYLNVNEIIYVWPMVWFRGHFPHFEVNFNCVFHDVHHVKFNLRHILFRRESTRHIIMVSISDNYSDCEDSDEDSLSDAAPSLPLRNTRMRRAWTAFDNDCVE